MPRFVEVQCIAECNKESQFCAKIVPGAMAEPGTIKMMGFYDAIALENRWYVMQQKYITMPGMCNTSWATKI